MKYYVELWSKNKNYQILGNLDGQQVLNCQHPERTKEWNHLLPERLPKVRKFRNDDSLFYRLVTEKGQLVKEMH